MTNHKGKLQLADLIMEGGGVKGIGLVGALDVLEEQGYEFRRVAGTSAGAVAGSLVAAGMKSDDLNRAMREVSFASFQDEGFIDHFGLIGKALSVIFEKGIYEGNFLRQWLGEQLERLGVRTFGDLKLHGEWAKSLPPNQRYKLVVLASDVSRGRLVRLPWDYHEYGLDPDKQLVVDAVRASISIPFYYEPVKLGGNFLVDGGIISNFPIWLFESRSHKHDTDIPMLGIKLSAQPDAQTLKELKDTSNTFNYGFSILSSMISSMDQIHLDDPCTVRRTIFVDTDDIVSTQFDLPTASQDFLYKSGQAAARKFLKEWDFKRFLKQCNHK